MEPAAPSALPTRSALVADALAAAGLPGTVRRLADSARTAAEAAAALGCEVGAIANSLVFVSDGEPVLVLTSGRHRVDTAALAARWAAARSTGPPRAGPGGHRPAHRRRRPDRPPPPAADRGRSGPHRLPRVWAAAGTPHTVFPTTTEELLRLTHGTLLPVGP
nr:YbaK/EbsC family protein [Kitasatospora fiedleri]